MLKKQTVWLLTMLSLIVVLSVYALTAQNQSNQNQASQETKTAQTVTGKNQKAEAVSKADNKLGQIELDKADERAQLQQKYQNVIASKKSSAKAVSAAYDKMEAMQTLANDETMLEDVIQSKGFKNAVVKTAGNNVQVFVDSAKLTDKQANEVIRLADHYLGAGKVISVSYAL
ncbi:MAG: SpoIIIAH-like family protein, partial [Sporolactobacillus sp.]